jgi:hypothetical protein
MSSFPILDVVVGLGFLYLLFALACTALNEVIATALDRRGKMLRAGVEKLLGDRELTNALFQQPGIQSISRTGRNGLKPPSYISNDRFATVLTDYLTGDQPVTDAKALAEGVEKLNGAPKRQLKVLLALSKGDPEAFIGRVAEWYEQGMDRVSGWYKRGVQRQTYAMAVVIVLALNLDSVQLINRLWSDAGFRTAAVEQARARIQATGVAELPVVEYTGGDAADAGVPVVTGMTSLTDSETRLLTSLRGWQDDRMRLNAALVLKGDAGAFWVGSKWLGLTAVTHFLGWIITVLAIALGAPFWFDILNRFMNLRTAGRATDEPRSKV